MQKLFHIRRIRLALLLALATAALMLSLTFVTSKLIGSSATAQVEEDIGNSLAELAYQTVDKLDQGMYERYREVSLLAERYEIVEGSVALADKRRVLDAIQRTYPLYAWIGLADTAGKVRVATGGLLEGADVSQRPWFSAATRGQHLSDVHEAKLLAKLLPGPAGEPKRFFDIAFPYRNAKGEVQGVLGTHLSWQWAAEIEQSILQPLANRKSVDTLIVSETGVVLLGPKQYAGTILDQASFRQARAGKMGSLIETWPDGKRYLVGYHHSKGYRGVKGLGWSVLVRQELESAYRPVHELRRKILLGGLLASVVALFLALGLARTISRPLREITRYAGDLNAEKRHIIPQIANAFAEVRILHLTLNRLLSKLQRNERGLLELNASLEARVMDRTAELHIAVEELGRLARSDALTGLPNRRSYEERLVQAVARAARQHGAIALMFLDIDHFKQVNDTLGHAGGDLVLQEFGQRIRSSVRATDTVCRLAGDEFTVILEGLKNDAEATLVASKILASINIPFQIDGESRLISTSIGIAFHATGPFSTELLNLQADAALYRAKENGRSTFAMNVL